MKYSGKIASVSKKRYISGPNLLNAGEWQDPVLSTNFGYFRKSSDCCSNHPLALFDVILQTIGIVDFFCKLLYKIKALTAFFVFVLAYHFLGFIVIVSI